MRCSDIGEFELWEAKYRSYICTGTTSFFLRLTLVVRYSKSVKYWNGILIIDFHTIAPYLYEDERLTYKKLGELLKKAKSEDTEVVRYVFSLGPTLHVLTPEPEVFKRIFLVKEAGVISWVTLGRQAVRYVDGVVSMFGMHKAPQTLLYLVECVTKKYLEKVQSR